MVFNENIHWITKYFLFNCLILFHLCFAQDDIELSLENDEDMSLKFPRRRLLSSSFSNMNGTEFAIYVVAVIVITLIAICCKYCVKNGCDVTEDYSDAVVHPPPRRQYPSVPVAPSSGTRVLSPPRSSRSIILPPEEGIFTVDMTGIENPNYQPSFNSPMPAYHPPTAPRISISNDPSNENSTPMNDLPPSYESVIREQKSSK